MALLVQKFGGTSVGNLERINAIAKRIAIRHEEGNSLVIVVSAMGGTTDELMNMAYRIHPNPPSREIDMLLATGEQVSIALLSIALNKLGIAAVSMTGAQVGIITEATHGQARILKVHTERISKYLEQDYVVIVAGFQGTSRNANGFPEITTLGRGGSDTSAVAIAAALNADACEIYTDVIGILTTDPRTVETAQLIQTISCDEMLELASLGAAVLHPRAVEIARNYGVLLSVRSSWTLSPGTLLIGGSYKQINEEGLELGKSVYNAELIENQAAIRIYYLPDIPGITATLFEGLAKANLNVDLISQTGNPNSTISISFTLGNQQLKEAYTVCRRILNALRANEAIIIAEGEMAKLSISGVGIMSRHGILALLLEALAGKNIKLTIIATSEVKVSCLINEKDGSKSLKAVLQAFGITECQLSYSQLSSNLTIAKVRGVALDMNQVQISVRNIPDSSEIAAAICRGLADAFIRISAMVQSENLNEASNLSSRDITFILHKNDQSQVKDILSRLLYRWPEIKFEDGPTLARVSAVGGGIKGTLSIAAQMFRSLSIAGINIQMITTSEIRTSCMVHEVDGPDALQSVHSCFELGKTV
uniref:aspartate kinase n=1 Tax=Paulinella longichromatophora TaxID=1708747 RepID=A0A2H4ZPJ0_9EUKA|nr:aspartate kinase [Paulinella longichromatophora]